LNQNRGNNPLDLVCIEEFYVELRENGVEARIFDEVREGNGGHRE